MSSEALAASAALATAAAPDFASAIREPALAAQPLAAAPSAGFGSLVRDGLEQVNQQLLASQGDLQQLALGNVQNLHQVMIRLEESRLSFALAMQVRNRLLEAYQDVMKMPV